MLRSTIILFGVLSSYFVANAQHIDGDPVTAKLAKRHLKDGMVYYLTYKTTGNPEQEYCQREVTKKEFGFRYYRVPGCANALDIEEIKKYNKVVKKYLDKQHGEGWEKSLMEAFRKAGCL